MKKTNLAKKFLCAVLCLFMLMPMSFIYSFATETDTAYVEEIEPRYTTISRCNYGLVISGINSTTTATVTTSTTQSLKITIYFQKLSGSTYNTIETWTASKTGTSLTMEKSRLINILCDYRSKITFTAGSETVTYYAYP